MKVVAIVLLLFLVSCGSDFPEDLTGEYSKETLKILSEGYQDCLNTYGWKNEVYCQCLHDVRAYKRVGPCEGKFVE